ncbi:MAG TPA: serine hydrolase [Blastocatellia bacterium]|nr:serine hydrolase [Blastocatellia bacterium]
MVHTYRLRSRAPLFLAAIFLLACQGAAIAQDRAAKINAVLTRASQLGQFNGAALVAEKGKVIFKKGFGFANMDWNIPNAPDTRFRIGSMTKEFTSMLILQLVNQGQIKLDGKLSDYLPDYRKDTGDKVTIHHLLNHTSGIPDRPGFGLNESRDPYTVPEFIKKFASGDLEFEPGTKFSYNNTGYFLLGAIIEKVTGKTYEQVLRENILEPVGMKDTGYDHQSRVIARRASGYVKGAGGYMNVPFRDMSTAFAAGGLYSTVEDLYLWDQALYTDKLLPARMKELMFKPGLETYAYGWYVRNESFTVNNEPVLIITHGGQINGFNGMIVRYPARKNLIVIIENASQGVRQLREIIGRILYDQPYEMPKASGADALAKIISDKGLAAAVAQYREWKAKASPDVDISEQEINGLADQLLRDGKTTEAIEILKLNVGAYPQSSAAYNSLGEAYVAAEQKELAIQALKKALELNPQSENIALRLKSLEGKAVAVDPKVYASYVGEYEAGPRMITVSKESEKLMIQVNGQRKLEMVPESDTAFFISAVNVKATFIKDEAGQVTGLVINSGGRDIRAKKIK